MSRWELLLIDLAIVAAIAAGFAVLVGWAIAWPFVAAWSWFTGDFQ
jgi:hypothetical protein